MKSPFDLENKVVVITGGAGLIGKSFVKAVARNGGTAIIADVDERSGNRVKQEILKEPGSGKVEFFELDISSGESVKNMIDGIVEKYEVIDALVNNALPRNKHYGRDFEDVTLEDFCENTGLHLGGYFLMCQQVSRAMVKQKQGVIVNMASIYGFMAPRFELYDNAGFTSPVEYSAIKGGVISLTKYLASYLARHNIRVNAISPGGVYNKQPESFVAQYTRRALVENRMAEPDELAGALVYLLSDASKYVTGQNFVVDGGWSI